MGKKITQYTQTQTSFDPDDLFDVSAYVSPSNYITRKYNFADFQAAIFPSGSEGNSFAYHSGAWQATDLIHFDFTNTRIGIGTASPVAPLDVYSTLTGISVIAGFRNPTADVQIMGVGTTGLGLMLGQVNASSYQNNYGSQQDTFINGNNNLNYYSAGNHKFWGGSNAQSNSGTPDLTIDATNGSTFKKKVVIKRVASADYFDCLNGSTHELKIQDGGYLYWDDFSGAGYSTGFRVKEWVNSGGLTNNCYVTVEVNGQQIKLMGEKVV